MIADYKQALKDISKILYTNDETGFYSDEVIVESLKDYLQEFIEKEKQGKATWKTRDYAAFRSDIAELTASQLSQKYNLTYQGAWYHCQKHKKNKKIN